METTKQIVAIDLGTSKIVGIVGTKDADGNITVIAIDTESSDGCILRGCIHNVEETTIRIKKIIAKLENRISKKITAIYVGIGGQSLRTINHTLQKQLLDEAEISQDLLYSMKNEAQRLHLSQLEVLEVHPTEFMLDNNIVSNPLGIFCSNIKADYKLVVARPSLHTNLNRCIVEKAKSSIAGFFASPIAAAEAMLSASEKNLGCAFIDFGAGTTSLVIFHDNFLRYAITIPMGGHNITRDICSLSILEDDAERYKITYGSAIHDETMSLPAAIEGIDPQRINYTTLQRIVEARSEEIVENVLAQIEESGYGNLLNSGLIIAGGGSQLKNLSQLLINKTSMKVRASGYAHTVTFVNQNEKTYNPAYVQAVGFLMKGEKNCTIEKELYAEMPQVTQTVAPKEKQSKDKNFRGKQKGERSRNIFDKINNFFEDNDKTLDTE